MNKRKIKAWWRHPKTQKAAEVLRALLVAAIAILLAQGVIDWIEVVR